MLNKVEEHRKICKDMTELYERKNHDYGNSFAKVRKSVGPNAILVRLYDKIERLNTLLNGAEQKVKDESIDDCFMDLANYCILEMIERRVDKIKEVGNQGCTDPFKTVKQSNINQIDLPHSDSLNVCFDESLSNSAILTVTRLNGNVVDVIDLKFGDKARDVYNMLIGNEKR